MQVSYDEARVESRGFSQRQKEGDVVYKGKSAREMRDEVWPHQRSVPHDLILRLNRSNRGRN